MTDENDNSQNLVDRLMAILPRLPQAEVLGDVLKTLHKAIQGRSRTSVSEVLECESGLELKNFEGKKAAVRKREEVRYVQDNVIAYQNHAWGDGEIPLNYQCTPDRVADQYRSGYKKPTY